MLSKFFTECGNPVSALARSAISVPPDRCDGNYQLFPFRSEKPFDGQEQAVEHDPSELGDANDCNPVDVHVGSRLRERRIFLHMTQEKLALELGITFQQVQKYEKGVNRIGASRLFDLARVMGVEIGYFFEGLSPDQAPFPTPQGHDVPVMPILDASSKRETLELIRAYTAIRDPQIRRRVYDLARTLASSSQRNFQKS